MIKRFSLPFPLVEALALGGLVALLILAG